MNRQNRQNNGNSIASGSVSNQLVARKTRQNGMTAIGMAIILALIAFFALLALRLAPIYLENFSVSSHLKRLAAESGTKSLSDHEIYSTLEKRFQIDDVKNVNREHISIDRQGGAMVIDIDYEVRTPAVGNVDMVVSFKEEAIVK